LSSSTFNWQTSSQIFSTFSDTAGAVIRRRLATAVRASGAQRPRAVRRMASMVLAWSLLLLLTCYYSSRVQRLFALKDNANAPNH